MLNQSGMNSIALTEKNMEHLLNGENENLWVCALNDANVINLTIDAMDVGAAVILAAIVFQMQIIQNACHAPTRSPLGHDLAIEVETPGKVFLRMAVIHVRSALPLRGPYFTASTLIVCFTGTSFA